MILSEEVSQKHLNLADITSALCDLIEARSEKGWNHGVVLIPDGLLSALPEMRQLIEEVNATHRSGKLTAGIGVDAKWDLLKYLSPLSQGVFSNLPEPIQYQIRTFVSPSTEVFKFK